MSININKTNCVVFHGGFCRSKHELDSMYVYMGLVTLSLICLGFIITFYITRRKKLVKRGDGVLLFSLLWAHFLNNMGILGLTTVQVVKGFVPETSFRKYKIVRTLSICCTIIETIVSTNILVLTIDRFLTIYMNLRYEKWMTRSKQNIMLCGAWVGPLFLAGIIITYDYVIKDGKGDVISLVAVIMVNSTTLIVVVAAHAYIIHNLKSHLCMMVRITIQENREIGKKRSRKKLMKIFEISFCLLFSFTVAYSFDVVVKALKVTKSYVPDELLITGYYLFTLNSLCNSFVYMVTNKRLKKSLMALIGSSRNEEYHL